MYIHIYYRNSEYKIDIIIFSSIGDIVREQQLIEISYIYSIYIHNEIYTQDK
jgi:hypothetical protein